MFDYHVHSNYSSDCKTKMEDIISTAISRGISKIAITDHIDFDLGLENEFRYDERMSEINRLRDKYYGQIEIVNGVEIGIDISDIERVESYLAKHPFEFKIMSIHMVNRLELYTEEIFNHYHPEDVLMMYLDEMFYAVNHFDDYDVIGHMDYLRRYNEEIKSFDIKDFIEYYEVVLKAIIKNGKSLEINTSSLYYGDNDFYPNEEILKSYSRLGGKYISIGSDSHQSHTLGFEFNRALMIAKKHNLEIIKL